jgi:hypothetical protein
MVTNTPVGVLRAVVILPSCLDFTVVHRLLRQTSTCRDHGRNELVTEDCAWIPGKPELIQKSGSGKSREQGAKRHWHRLPKNPTPTPVASD